MKRIALMLLLLVTLFCFTACRKEYPNRVRIACFPNITHSQALVGRAQNSLDGIFGDDVEVEWLTFNAGPSEIEAFFAGEVDIGYIGPLPAINGYSKSAGDIRIIAGATGAGSLLVTRRDLVLDDIKQLDGKKVAVPQFCNTQDILLRDVLASVGLEDKNTGGTVEIIASENPNIKPMQAINLSCRMTKGHKLDLFVLGFSFIGWYMLGALAFGIGTAFVVPYDRATHAQFYLALRSEALNKGTVTLQELEYGL